MHLSFAGTLAAAISNLFCQKDYHFCYDENDSAFAVSTQGLTPSIINSTNFTDSVYSQIESETNSKVIRADFEYIQRPLHNDDPLSTKIKKRQVGDYYFVEPLDNVLTYYTMNVSIGNPMQPVGVLVDTGSSDLWVPGSQNRNGFDTEASSSWRLINENFSIKYVKGYAKGSWGKDDITLCSGTQLMEQTFAVASDSSEPDMGVLGIGPKLSEVASEEYENVPANLVAHGHISRNIYSIYLNDMLSNRGSVLFGGIDQEKYEGELHTVPMLSDSIFQVSMDSIRIGNRLMDTSVVVALDTGTSLMYLPPQLVENVANEYGAKFDENLDVYILSREDIETKPLPGIVHFDIMGSVIKVPGNELFWPVNWFDTTNTSGDFALTIMPNTKSMGFNILGDTFLRSAYVTFDLDSKHISLAPVRYSKKSNIIPISDEVPGTKYTGPLKPGSSGKITRRRRLKNAHSNSATSFKTNLFISILVSVVVSVLF
jgi:Eukaryotic aspartyl protease